MSIYIIDKFFKGDDGGPLMCGDGLSGIVSWGAGCAGWYPTVHTQTSYYIQWIDDVINQ